MCPLITFRYRSSLSKAAAPAPLLCQKIFCIFPYIATSIQTLPMNSDHLKYSNPTTSRVKSRFTTRFVRSLTKIRIQLQQPPTGSCHGDIYKRYRQVKIAADKSLALAVGTRRAWSRALLWKIRHRHRRHRLTTQSRMILCRNMNHCLVKKKITGEKKKKDKGDGLRKLIPGGEGMDMIKLLDESAHYLQCLVTQVQVMRNIHNFCSTA